jgi:hypothetical protein
MPDQELVPMQAAPPVVADSLLSVIAQAAADPRVDVAKMQALVDLKLQINRETAAQEFAAAMARLQPRLPRIAKNGKIEFNGNSQPYAKYEDIIKVCRPLLDEEGFSTSYSFEDGPSGSAICVCTVSHRAGHSKSFRTPPLPMDKSGSKNAVQAVGSTMQYGKRYAFCSAFDIVADGLDRDGHEAGCITQEQADQIRDMITECNFSAVAEKAFWDLVGVKKVDDLPAARYPAVMESLRKKLQQVRGRA